MGKPTNTAELGRAGRNRISESLFASHFTEISKSDYSLSMKDLSQPHISQLVKFVKRLRKRFPDAYVPDFDMKDVGIPLIQFLP